MKANQNAKTIPRDRGEVGIGTMIVFIAAVIVAAVAAAVLIDTAGNLQRKASETGKETTQEVAANMFVRDIIGKDDANDDDLDEVYVYLSLAPGAEPIDLNSTVIRWKYSSDFATLEVSSTEWNCDTATPTQLSDGFCLRNVHETSSPFDGVLDEGDRVRLEVHLSSTETISTRGTVELLIISETGSPVDASFKTPATFGGNDYVSLF